MTIELAISILVGETIGTTEQTREAVKMAVDALKADAPDIYVGKWIPTSEKPPDEDGQYLTYHSTHGHPYYRTCSFAHNLYKVDKYDFHDCKGKAGFYDLDSEYGYYKIDDVEAWMEIPKYESKN